MNRSGASPALEPRRRRHAVGLLIGLVLLGLAVWVVASRRDELAGAAEKLGSAPWWMIASVLLFPAASWVTTSASLGLLTRRYGSVGALEMFELIGSATLLNYLPLRPGLIGRLAYHKRVNRIPVRDSVRVLVEGLTLSILSALVLLAVGLTVRGERAVAIDGAILATPALLCALSAWAVPSRRTRLLLFAASIRYADMLIWVGRYAVLLAILGRPVGLSSVVVIASLSQLAMMAPTGGGGIGVREWTVGLIGGTLVADLQTTALAADLLNRAVEVLIVVPAGLWGTSRVRKRLHAARARAADPGGTDHPSA